MTHDLDATNQRIAEAERELQGTVGVAARPLDAGEPEIAYKAEQPFPAASTIKVFVLQTLLERVERSEADLDEEIVLREQDQVTGSGVLKSLSPDRAYTLRDLATLMIIVSDNTATNLLIERLGQDAVNAVARAHGWRQTHLAGLLQRPRPNPADDTGPSTTSPRDLADYFTRLWRGELLPPALSEVARSIYRRQQRTDQLGRYLPFDPYSTETGTDQLTIASKSGSIRGVRNDAGVIDTGRTRYVVAVMTRDCPDPRFHPDNLGGIVVSKVSRAVYELLTGNGTQPG